MNAIPPPAYDDLLDDPWFERSGPIASEPSPTPDRAPARYERPDCRRVAMIPLTKP